MYLFIDI
jgi:hypothetical protein